MKKSRVKTYKGVEELEGWYSLPVAGAVLDVSRQRLFQMKDEGLLKTIKYIAGTGTRPAAYVVERDEIDTLKKKQAEAAEAARVKEAAKLEAAAR